MTREKTNRWGSMLAIAALAGISHGATLAAQPREDRRVTQSTVQQSAVSQKVVHSSRGADPGGRTYYTVFVGTGDTVLELGSDCLTFSATELCISDGTCGTWQPTFQEGKRSGFEFDFVLVDEDGVTFNVEGHGRVDSKGPRSSVGAAARAAAEGATINFSLAGRSTARDHCHNLLEIDGL